MIKFFTANSYTDGEVKYTRSLKVLWGDTVWNSDFCALIGSDAVLI